MPESWVLIHLPALAVENDQMGREVGEALCPERYTREELLAAQLADPNGFASLYQGRPSPADGDVFKASNLIEYTKLPEKGFRFATVDLAHSTKERADYSVVACFLLTPAPGPKLYVTHLFRDRVDSGRHMTWLDESIDSIPKPERPSFIGVEDKTFGSTLLGKARHEGRRGRPLLRPLKADKDKVTRAQAAATMSTQGQLLFPAGAPWLPDVTHELLMFPNGTHDDCVDVISYGAITAAGMPQRSSAPKKETPIDTPERKAAAHIKRLQRAKKPSLSRRKSIMN